MKTDEIVVGGVYRVAKWKRPRRVLEVGESNGIPYVLHTTTIPNYVQDSYVCTELDRFAAWAMPYTEKVKP